MYTYLRSGISSLRPGFLLALLLAGTMQSWCQTDSVSGILPTIERDAGRAFRCAWFVAGSPFRWQSSDWLIAGGVGAGTFATSLADEDIRSRMISGHTATKDRFESIAVAYGDGAYALSAAGGAYLAGLFFHGEWLRETALMSCEAMLLSGAVSTVTKIVVGRARPYTGLGHGSFSPLKFDEDRNSFPSGHTVIAFSLSTVLARRIDNPIATVLLYGLATSTAVGRMYGDYHWLSDVVFGGAISVALASSVVSWHQHEQESGSAGFRILPSGNGLSLVWIL
jgi:membrane-associated phospholipid phosphatase